MYILMSAQKNPEIKCENIRCVEGTTQPAYVLNTTVVYSIIKKRLETHTRREAIDIPRVF